MLCFHLPLSLSTLSERKILVPSRFRGRRHHYRRSRRRHIRTVSNMSCRRNHHHRCKLRFRGHKRRLRTCRKAHSRPPRYPRCSRRRRLPIHHRCTDCRCTGIPYRSCRNSRPGRCSFRCRLLHHHKHRDHHIHRRECCTLGQRSYRYRCKSPCHLHDHRTHRRNRTPHTRFRKARHRNPRHKDRSLSPSPHRRIRH